MIVEYHVLSSSEVNATTRTSRSALSSPHRLGGGPEQALEQVRLAFERIRSNPLAYPVAYRGTRRALIGRFPYGVSAQGPNPS